MNIIKIILRILLFGLICLFSIFLAWVCNDTDSIYDYLNMIRYGTMDRDLIKKNN